MSRKKSRKEGSFIVCGLLNYAAAGEPLLRFCSVFYSLQFLPLFSIRADELHVVSVDYDRREHRADRQQFALQGNDDVPVVREGIPPAQDIPAWKRLLNQAVFPIFDGLAGFHDRAAEEPGSKAKAG